MSEQQPAEHPILDRRRAVSFVVLIGIVSLFSDMTYEGARSVTGPYLSLLGATGTPVLMVAVAVSAVFPVLVFLGGFTASLLGMVAWGIGMGAQESIMRAFVGTVVPPERRASAYGTFNACYGIAWFLGSALMGRVYDASPLAVAVFSVIGQLAALPLLQLMRRRMAANHPALP